MAGIRDETFPMRQWGLPERGELDRVVMISPHLDDAVLGCGRFMAVHPGCTVITVFATRAFLLISVLAAADVGPNAMVNVADVTTVM